MSYSKLACFCYLLCIVVLSILVQEQDCGRIFGRTSPVKTSCPTLKLANGKVRLRSKGRVARYVCADGFKVVGERTATCVRGRWEGTVPLCVKTGCLRVFQPKNGQMLELFSGAVLSFFCNHGYSLNGSRNIYCNGILWNGTVPTCQVDGTEPEMSCDFENEDICGWNQDSHRNFDWRRHNFATPSGHVGTGPSYDHTKGKGLDGNYMYIESSSPRMVNDTARLFSPVYPADTSEDACFIFWYHMFGVSTGSLNIYQKPEDADLATLKPLFVRSGDQGNQWLRGLVRLEATNKSFQVIVEGIRGASYVSDSAIDDVLLTNGTDCLEPDVDTSESTPNRIETGGGGEVFDDAQSCRFRCSSNPSYAASPNDDPAVETPVMVLCECHVGCLDNGTCCPDYSSYCIMAKVTSQPVVPTLEYRTIASVHYFPLPPPLPKLPIPPPLPPLPPKPTLMTSLELPYSTQTITNITTQNTLVFDQQTYSEIPSVSFDANSQPPTMQTFSETPQNSLTTNIEENDLETTYLPGGQFLSTMLDNIISELPEIEIKNTFPTNLPPLPTDINIPSSKSSVLIDKETQILRTSLTPILVSNQNPYKFLNITTSTTKMSTIQLPEIVSVENENTFQNNTGIVSNPRQVYTQTPTTLMKKPVKLATERQTQRTKVTKKLTTATTPKRTIPTKKTTLPPVRKPVVPKRTTTTQRPTTKNEILKKTTKNKMMYYPNLTGGKSKDAETNYLLKKDLLDQPKGNSGKLWPQPRQAVKDSTSTNASMIIGLVGGIALLLVAFGVTMCAVVRRRRVSGRRSNLSDDSDVRFLTADEVLDFNMARPTEDYDRS